MLNCDAIIPEARVTSKHDCRVPYRLIVVSRTPIDRLDLNFGDSELHATVYIPQRRLLAVTLSDSEVRFYEHDTHGNTLLVFEKHSVAVVSLLHLDYDILASIDRSGRLLTWNVCTDTVLEEMMLNESGHCDYGYGDASLAKLSPGAMTIASKGRVRNVTHTSGRDLKQGLLGFPYVCDLNGTIFVATEKRVRNEGQKLRDMEISDSTAKTQAHPKSPRPDPRARTSEVEDLRNVVAEQKKLIDSANRDFLELRIAVEKLKTELEKSKYDQEKLTLELETEREKAAYLKNTVNA